jgi:hypothetical protein
VIPVTPSEEAAVKSPRILDAAEALGELRLVFQGFEMRLRQEVIARGMRSATRLGDTEIGQQDGRGIG